MTPKSIVRGVLVAIGSFFVLGTVAALWPNPFFMRMTPTGGFEVALLAAQSVLLGVFFAIPVTACATKLASVGGVASFLGVACPICNKILLLLFGSQLLMTYLEPARIYLAAAGALITGIAVVVRWRQFRATNGAGRLAGAVTS